MLLTINTHFYVFLAFSPPPLVQACPSFHHGPFISGAVKLRPKAVKDAETTGKCVQVFNVFDCAPGALIVQVGEDDPFQVDRGDQFFIPTHTTYKLQNYSSDCSAQLFYVVIKSNDDDA
jgi:mannose-6-phosphate isomerase-like protein (cupin superfamily)